MFELLKQKFQIFTIKSKQKSICRFNKLQHKISKYEHKYGYDSTLKARWALIRLALWSLKNSIFPPTVELGYVPIKLADFNKKNNVDLVDPDNTINICLSVYGGFGDTVVGLNFLIAFSEFFKDYPIQFTFRGDDNKSMAELFPESMLAKWRIKYPKYSDSRGEMLTQGFDLALYIVGRVMAVEHRDIQRLSKMAPRVLTYIEDYERIVGEDANALYREVTNYIMKDNIINDLLLIRGCNRAQQPDLVGALNIKKSMNFRAVVTEDLSREVLNRFNLYKRKFITINRGWDIKNTHLSDSHTKVWSLEYYNKLIDLIKRKYPEYLIVQVGVNFKVCKSLEGVDVNLVAKTSMRQLKVLLKESILHIDCEGGMVHLRQVLSDNPAIVTFGPTDIRIFGYENNINLQASGCLLPTCEWISNDWMRQCIKNGTNKCERLLNLTPDIVMQYVESYLEQIKK